MIRSIRTKLVLSHLSLILFAALFLGSCSYYLFSKNLEEAEQEKLEMTAANAVARLEKFVAGKVAVMRRMAASREVDDYTETYRDMALTAYLSRFADEFHSLSFINPAGQEEVKVLEGKPSSHLMDMGRCSCFLKAKSSPGKVVIDYFTHYQHESGPSFNLVIAKYRYFGNEFIGALLGHIPYSTISNELAKLPSADDDFITVIDRDGTVLITPETAHLLGTIGGSGRNAKALITDATALKKGFSRATLFGTDAFVAYAPVTDLGWSVLVSLPYERFTAQTNRLLLISLGVFLVTCLIGAQASYILARNISSPLIRVSALARAIAKGSSGEKIPAHTQDEVGVLVESFNAMVDDLRRTTISRDYVDNILRSMNECLIVIDRNGNIESANARTSALLGYAEDELIGLPLEHLFPVPNSRNATVYQKMLNEKSVYDLDIFFQAKSGRRIPVTFSKSELRDGDGNDMGAVCVALDISERKNAEQEREKLQTQLQRAQKLETVGTLAGGIAHDFNNILTAIIGFSELIQQDLPKDTANATYITHVLESGRRAQDLIKQLLSFSRRTEQERMPLHLHVIIKEILKLLRASIPSTVKICQDIDAHCGAVLADSTQMHQLIMNLCTNAAQAMEENGGILQVDLAQVMLGADASRSYPDLKPGAYARLTISDTGHGMSKETQARIFDPFFSTKEVGKGSGLGLSVVHGIVASHNGTITVDSEIDHGSTFEILFPIVNAEVVQSPVLAAPLLTGSEHILFVDDEVTVASLAKQMLERLGYTLTVKNNSAEALATFRAAPDKFDLIITDQTMPDIVGSELARKMLEIKSDMPIILCTGYSAAITEEAAREIGIKAFVMKPFGYREITEAIRRALHPGT